jgi:hypothetical protein
VSVNKSAHDPAQSTVPAGQVQAPFWQISSPPQLTAHRPQWLLLFWRSTQARPHAVNPGAVQRAAHLPSLQMGSLRAHVFPHIPQFASSEARSTQVPGLPKRSPHFV